jgi:hypothetical protein
MQQSKIGSAIEAGMNVLIGYGIAVASQVLIFPLYGVHIPLASNFTIGLWFTVISLVRSYALRRWFNARLHKASEALAGIVNEELARERDLDEYVAMKKAQGPARASVPYNVWAKVPEKTVVDLKLQEDEDFKGKLKELTSSSECLPAEQAQEELTTKEEVVAAGSATLDLDPGVAGYNDNGLCVGLGSDNSQTSADYNGVIRSTLEITSITPENLLKLQAEIADWIQALEAEKLQKVQKALVQAAAHEPAPESL